jgi:hypothetical protein
MAEQRQRLSEVGQAPAYPTVEQEAESINAREEFLLRARRLGRRIQERVWEVMEGETLRGPHAAFLPEGSGEKPDGGA